MRFGILAYDWPAFPVASQGRCFDVDNYDFCAEFAAIRGGRVLDYGCGQGRIVSLLRARNVESFGCDVFYEGGNLRNRVPLDMLESGIVKEMIGDRIPFPDAFFDVVVNNQVMEHVPDLTVALSEIFRVLRPGGVVLSLFPDSSVWREGHCGVPFVHWFPRGRLRIYYAFACRALGLGHFHERKTYLKWSEDFCQWLDRWTYYRPYKEIAAAFESRFGPIHHIEAEWLDARRKLPVPAVLKRLVVRRLGGLVIWCEKHQGEPGAAGNK